MAFENNIDRANHEADFTAEMQSYGAAKNNGSAEEEEHQNQKETKPRVSPFWQTALILISFLGLVMKTMKNIT